MILPSPYLLGTIIGLIGFAWISSVSCSHENVREYEVAADANGDTYKAQVECDSGKTFDLTLYGAHLPQKVQSSAFRQNEAKDLKNCKVYIQLATPSQSGKYRWLSKSGKQNVMYQSVDQSVSFSESGDTVTITAKYYKTHDLLNSSPGNAADGLDYPTCQMPTAEQIQGGWGWENGKSCRVRLNPAPSESQAQTSQNSGATQYPDCQSAASEKDGSGWGWENGQSCRVVRSPSPSPSPQQPSAQASQQYPNCRSAETDKDGDGWGWENGQSCRVVSR